MAQDVKHPKGRYIALDSLRGVCACMVVLLHFGSQSHFYQLPMIKHGYLFVDFFFVLSGFVIATSYGQRLANDFPIGRFMWLRLWRVYPLHLVMLAIFMLFEIFFAVFVSGSADRKPFEGAYSAEIWFYSLALIQIFFGPEGTPWNGPSWSIAAEVWTYLIFAVLLRYVFRWVLPICLLIAIFAPVILFYLTDRYMNVFHEGALLRCLFGFSLGVVGWYMTPYIQRIILGGKARESAFEIAVVALVVAFVSTCGTGPKSLAAPFVFLIAVMTFSRERGWVSSLLLTKPLERLGSLSYSIYMIHAFLLYRFVNGLSVFERLTGYDAVQSVDGHNTVGGGVWFGDLVTVLFLGIVIVLSEISYRYIEMPGNNFARNRVRRQSASPLPATPGAP